MIFSSITFLFYFLPAILFAYFIVPRRFKNLTLFIGSLIFYAWGEPIYVILMLISTMADFLFGKAAFYHNEAGNKKKAKLAVFGSVAFNLSMLCFFKYADFILETMNTLFHTSLPLLELPLPIGISFYTFQTMSYTIDVYRGDAKPQKSMLDLGTYVALFPQLIAGPIVRYSTIAGELTDRKESLEGFAEGIKRFSIGMGKKVLLANQFGEVFTEIAALGLEKSTLSAWIGMIGFSLQIYFDFSGYSDMAIGLGRMFGFTFLENFDYPYISRSITEFFRRWHISLGTWFRDYVYIPLGGNRKGRKKMYLNLLLVWFFTGLWHGAAWNFAVWGMYFGFFILLEKAVLLKYLQKLPKIFSHVYTIFFVILGWVFFSIEKMEGICFYLKAMFGFSEKGIYDSFGLFYAANYGILFIIGFLGATPFVSRYGKQILKSAPVVVQIVIECACILCVLLLSTAYLVSGAFNPFLYFRF